GRRNSTENRRWGSVRSYLCGNEFNSVVAEEDSASLKSSEVTVVEEAFLSFLTGKRDEIEEKRGRYKYRRDMKIGVHGDIRLGGVKDFGFSYREYTKDGEEANADGCMDVGCVGDSKEVRWAGLDRAPGRAECAGISKHDGKGTVQAWAPCSHAVRRRPGSLAMDEAVARRTEILKLEPSMADARCAMAREDRDAGTGEGGRVAAPLVEKTRTLMEPDEEGPTGLSCGNNVSNLAQEYEDSRVSGLVAQNAEGQVMAVLVLHWFLFDLDSLKQHNGDLKAGAKASRAGRPWICTCLICGFADRGE
ncbi:hypothetical protein S245_044133, partial [Arachis hypogaea]